MRPLSIVVSALGLVTMSFASVMPEQQQILASDGPVRSMAGWRWDDCGLPTDAVRIKSIEVSPDPPQPGKDLTVKVQGIAQEVIEDGATADVTVKLGLIKILKKTFDICEEARSNNATIQCPVEKGLHIVEQTVALPKEIPKAKFVVDVLGYTAQEDDMFCLKLTVDFMTNPFPRIW